MQAVCVTGFCQQALVQASTQFASKRSCLDPGGTWGSQLGLRRQRGLSALQRPGSATESPRTREQRRCKVRLWQHYTGSSHAAGEQLREMCVAGWSAGDLGYTVQEGLLEEVHRSSRSCRRRSAQACCRSTGRQALTSTEFGKLDLLTVWYSVHHLCSREHTHRQERSPRVPVVVAEGCLQKQGSDFVTPLEIPLVLLVQGEDRQSSERAHPGNCCKCWPQLKLQVTRVVLDSLLQLQRFLEQSAVDPPVRS
ncbi:hypothetical protein NDU88_009307 [Pleurodeles waltl]|uniref:Uncharacterized protein n=1 Tax=Pleurodeles waltl TaxID=8319 RepID=A0AAV7QSL1_PLEWA|nr:hypothetical protein NDU88_009307 [Pleurodeles waltl]